MSTILQKIRNTILSLFVPVIRLIGKISLPYTKKDPMVNFYAILKKLKPMDIIVTASYGHLSNIFNPGKYKHAIAFIGYEKGAPMVIESISKGVVKKTLVECLSSKDVIAVLRPKKNVIKSDAQATKAIAWLRKQVGKPYDFVFDMNSQKKFDNFFCSELIYYAIKHVNPDTQFVLMETLGVPTVSPSDFYRADKKFTLIYETDRKK